MFVLRLNHLDIRTAALAIAEAARRRRRDDSLARASRRLADRLHEALPVTLARGEAYLDVPDEEAFLLRDALADACDGWSIAGPFRYRAQAQSLPFTRPEALLARLGAEA
mgnify:FL=1